MKFMIGWLLIISLLTLAAIEIGRYLRARRSPDDFPYPRRRLSRRIAISLDFSFVMLMVMFWPRTNPTGQLLMMAALLLAIVLGFVLLWRDLRETSQAALEHAAVLSRQTGESLKMILEHKADAGRQHNPSQLPPGPDNQHHSAS